MTVAAGDLRHYLTFKQPAVSTGDPAVTETTVFSLWGSLGGIGSSQQGLVADADITFNSRYALMSDGTMPGAQLVATMGTRRFNVRSVPQDPTGRCEEMVWFLQEVRAK